MSIATDETMDPVIATEMPKLGETEAGNDVDDIESLKDGDTVEIVSDTDEDETKLLCGCLYCEGAYGYAIQYPNDGGSECASLDILWYPTYPTGSWV
jgi:hypothetical protein